MGVTTQTCSHHPAQATCSKQEECTGNSCAENCFFCLVVGSRTFSNYPAMREWMDSLLCNQAQVVIISGGARGADTMAEQYAEERGYPCIVFPADWDRYGKAAGPIRNEQMHKFLATHPNRGVVAFWDGTSKGTKSNFALAKKYDNSIRVIIPSNSK